MSAPSVVVETASPAESTKAIVDLTKSVGRPVAYGNDAIRAALAATPA